jgi:ATP-dependent DNA helicase RecG
LIQEKFGIASGKLQENFRKTSGKPFPYWFLILELITLYPNINAEEISKIIGVSERTIYKYYNELQEKGMIERIGGRKEGFWQIIKQK